MKITLVITFVKPVLINEPVQGHIPAAASARPTRAKENGQNTMALLCIMVQLIHVQTHGLTKDMRTE